MPTQPKPRLSKAALHYQRAEEYCKLAQCVLDSAQPSAYALAQMVRAGITIHNIDADILLASAGALLYEAAKQCVNAVANLNGRDPRGNQEKMAELRTIANAHPNYPDLLDDSREAWHLHIHADQAHLTPGDLAYALKRTRRFIDDMQSIYHTIAPST